MCQPLSSVSCHPVPVYCCRLEEPVSATALGTLESSKSMLGDCFDRKREAIAPLSLWGTTKDHHLPILCSILEDLKNTWKEGERESRLRLEMHIHSVSYHCAVYNKELPKRSVASWELPEPNDPERDTTTGITRATVG